VAEVTKRLYCVSRWSGAAASSAHHGREPLSEFSTRLEVPLWGMRGDRIGTCSAAEHTEIRDPIWSVSQRTPSAGPTGDQKFGSQP
jgi:hypothetical protein